MPVIHSSIFVQASAEVCFDAALSIDIHMASTSRTRERAIAGRTSGLIQLGESVTWEAVHFGVKQRLTAVITELERPHRFVDEMVDGAFKRFWHEHRFVPQDGGTLMIDTFDYTAPLGWLGQVADGLFLTRYMDKFLRERNAYIKQACEQ
ncbi:ligand-binding SRPBCC domain-containing protein [Paenibacillus phyllosphaerae]|uniref:Ligand-binding SRPBCC domain-containing protein n=1 Tax=Paenibacillus phyllosphaerae TaxID=274593 RepID=A0A7W5FRJ8_9BACL|nr:SRPBCC family protein [Paenibacillus phyllosphaerae]MBB3114387.1 ligand-binding SRPBCC domain-containing protein [Paenibacillus phyllosphaerae]